MSDEENGEALEENRTLGLFVPLTTPPRKLVRKDSVNNRLDLEKFEGIKSTRPLLLVDRPPNSRMDREEDEGFQMVTNGDGDKNSPLTQTQLLLVL